MSPGMYEYAWPPSLGSKKQKTKTSFSESCVVSCWRHPYPRVEAQGWLLVCGSPRVYRGGSCGNVRLTRRIVGFIHRLFPGLQLFKCWSLVIT
jgi:hypothetical protein